MTLDRIAAEALRRQRAQQQAELRRASLRLDAEIDLVAAPVAAGGTTPRGLAERFADVVNVKDYGAKGDGIANDATAIQAAADAAKARKVGLYAPAGTYRLASTVTIREVATDFSAASVRLDAGAAMLVVGGRAVLALNPAQAFQSITRVGGSTAIPTCRVMGAKGQRIEIGEVDYLQLYADTSTGDGGPDYSIAYSSFHLGYCRKLELATNDGTPNSASQWINENAFFLNRAAAVIIRGTYGHNHNWFHAGTFEGGSLIDVQTGSTNIFWGGRFEGENTVRFAAGTWSNRIVPSWESNWNVSYQPTGGGPSVVEDLGEGNLVVPLAQMLMRRVPILAVNTQTCQVFSDAVGAIGGRGPNYTSLRGVDVQRLGPDTFHRGQWQMVYDSPLIPVSKGDNLVFGSDAALFRPQVKLFNAARARITGILSGDVTKFIRAPFADVTWDEANQLVSASSNLSHWNVAIVSPEVAFVEFDVQTGNGTSGIPFRHLSVTKMTAGRGAAEHSHTFNHAPVPPAVAASPARGFADVGTKVSNIAGGWFTATRALDTALATDAATGATAVTLTAATGIAPGDVIGVEIAPGGLTHWTTASDVAGAVVTLASPLPAAASAGARVVSNGWIAA